MSTGLARLASVVIGYFYTLTTRQRLNKFREQFEITAHPKNAHAVRERVQALAQQAGFTGLDLADIEIAVGEAVTNAILYGSPNGASHVQIVCSLSGSTFFVEIHDQGRGFNPSHVREEEDHDALGGRGIRLMRALMDEVDLHYGGDGMIARLSKTVPSS